VIGGNAEQDAEHCEANGQADADVSHVHVSSSLYTGSTIITGNCAGRGVKKRSRAAGVTTGWHTHRFPLAVYVLEGEFTLEYEGKEPITLKAGDIAAEPANLRANPQESRTSKPFHDNAEGQ
jgi:quercetin dioxygenase-like cupin family protein